MKKTDQVNWNRIIKFMENKLDKIKIQQNELKLKEKDFEFMIKKLKGVRKKERV